MRIIDSKYSRQSIAEINKEVSALSSEVKRIEKLEQSLLKHELVLVKKISDIHKIETKLESFANKREIAEMHKQLKKIAKHEDLLFENSKYVKEIVSELSKIKKSHKMTRERVMSRDNLTKKDFQEKMAGIKDSVKSIDGLHKTHKKKVDKKEVEHLRREMHDRMSQLEYHHKLLIKYFKKFDEKLGKR